MFHIPCMRVIAQMTVNIAQLPFGRKVEQVDRIADTRLVEELPRTPECLGVTSRRLEVIESQFVHLRTQHFVRIRQQPLRLGICAGGLGRFAVQRVEPCE